MWVCLIVYIWKPRYHYNQFKIVLPSAAGDGSGTGGTAGGTGGTAGGTAGGGTGSTRGNSRHKSYNASYHHALLAPQELVHS